MNGFAWKPIDDENQFDVLFTAWTFDVAAWYISLRDCPRQNGWWRSYMQVCKREKRTNTRRKAKEPGTNWNIRQRLSITIRMVIQYRMPWANQNSTPYLNVSPGRSNIYSYVVCFKSSANRTVWSCDPSTYYGTFPPWSWRRTMYHRSQKRNWSIVVIVLLNAKTDYHQTDMRKGWVKKHWTTTLVSSI